ncbi:hypothetical protein CDAR_294761 [Caerostris darwini]|uniref:Uncharacterized protein n=1 Tax=Caerostris darwini TaxID=1538125 RepID=A0AAV4UKK4_9ARAC|nr:hypothetical protein CDAR_294761 [Caerostris darwini]
MKNVLFPLENNNVLIPISIFLSFQPFMSKKKKKRRPLPLCSRSICRRISFFADPFESKISVYCLSSAHFERGDATAFAEEGTARGHPHLPFTFFVCNMRKKKEQLTQIQAQGHK